MTQKQFYNTYIRPYLKKDDKPFNRQLFCDTSDMLCKEGKITTKQYNSWTYPSNKFFR